MRSAPNPTNSTACRSFASLTVRKTTSGEWRADLENRLHKGDMAPALESHLAKYRKLVPALALINHLADGGAGPIGRTALGRASPSPNTSKPMPAAPTGPAR